MKAGDKCWVWSPLAYRNVGKIEEGEVIVWPEEPFADAWIRLHGRQQLYLFFKAEVFPTREALCEHYRKIFE